MKRTQVIRAFKRDGWYVRFAHRRLRLTVRPTKKGKEHAVLVKDGVDAILSIPRHSTIKHGTRNKLIKLAGLTVEEFLIYLKMYNNNQRRNRVLGKQVENPALSGGN